MKPIGSITLYYPFLNDENIAILERIVERADSFHDIAEGLIAESVNHDIDSDLCFITAILASLYPKIDVEISRWCYLSGLWQPHESGLIPP